MALIYIETKSSQQVYLSHFKGQQMTHLRLLGPPSEPSNSSKYLHRTLHQFYQHGFKQLKSYCSGLYWLFNWLLPFYLFQILQGTKNHPYRAPGDPIGALKQSKIPLGWLHYSHHDKKLKIMPYSISKPISPNNFDSSTLRDHESLFRAPASHVRALNSQKNPHSAT